MQTLELAVVMFFGLHLVIFIHELGHYWAGRRYNLAMPRFVVGLGPLLFSKQRGETSFEWRVIPIAGFVQILGIVGSNDSKIVRFRSELDLRLKLDEIDQGRSQQLQSNIQRSRALVDTERHYYSLRWWRQVAVMVAGPAMNIGLMFALFATSMIIEAVKPTLFEWHFISFRLPDATRGVAQLSDHFLIRTSIGEGDGWNVPRNATRIRRFRHEVGESLPVNAATIKTLEEGVLRPLGDPIVVCRAQAFDPIYGFKLAFGLTECLPAIRDHGTWEGLSLRDKWLQTGIHSFLLMLALTSVSIGLINLLPVPPLDGGRIVFSLLKGAGLELSEGVASRISMIGLACLLLYQGWNWLLDAIRWFSSM